MRKLITPCAALFLFFLAATCLAAPAAPVMSYSLNGTSITVDWSTVPDATGYTLYYAAYPYAAGDYIGSLDRGNNNSYSIDLWDGAAYYIATRSRNASGSSGYSNIEYFIIKNHELEWGNKKPLGSARTQFAGGVIDGKIYSFGGYDENGLLLNSLEIYDPSTDTWTAGSANSKSVADLSGAVQGGNLYVFGATSDDCSTTNFAERYDPSTDQWMPLTAKTTKASSVPAVTYKGKIYLFGGWDRTGCNSGKTLKRSVEVYNPANDSWHSATPMPKALEGAAVAVYDDKAYLMGGVDDQGRYATDIIAYDFVNETWIESGLGAVKTPRLFPASAAAPVIEDTIILAGGWVERGASSRRDETNLIESNVVELYRPRSRSVVSAQPLPAAKANHFSAVIDEDLFLVGGIEDEIVTDSFFYADITIENDDSSNYRDIDYDDDGYTFAEGDCDDTDISVNPEAFEICDDLIDQDCDGFDCSFDMEDFDGDGYSSADGDCDDTDASINPDTVGFCYDTTDPNCDGADCPSDSEDLDDDGYTFADGDCDDTDATINPYAVEICDDMIDQDCDGIDCSSDSEDFDGDGYTFADGDCDDTDASINPDAVEICGDTIDQDCDGFDCPIGSEDLDGDGYTFLDGDCDDTDAAVNPDAVEICDDTIDQDCDGLDCSSELEDLDGDGYSAADGDCDDADASIYPDAEEICDDAIDQNCDGTDCF